MAHGLPALGEMDAGRFASFIWWFLMHERDEQERMKFRNRLWQPPRGEVPTPDSPWSAANERESFRALKAGLGLSGAK